MMKFETVEEMVAWVVEHPQSDTRRTLEERLGIDDGYGKYRLCHWDGFRWNNVELSDSLGEELAKVWPQKPRWNGSSLMKFSGARTLAGVLKLLGRDDITSKVKEAKANDKAESEKRRRNSYRRNIHDKVLSLEAEIIEAKKVAGLNLLAPDFSELMTLLEEEA